ncbi:MAG: guanylate kinase [Acidobacteria bacterium]|nr:guanylate kinase [Acidobacteriota bacterium]
MSSSVSTGSLIVISAPSGAGKTTIVGELLRRDAAVRPSISFTSRAPRPGEIDGVHYHFVTLSRFQELIAEGELLEWALVHGNYYGTGRRAISELRASGFDVVLTIDVQGEQQVRRFFPEAVTVFVLPPSFRSLAERMGGRGDSEDAAFRLRLRNAIEEGAQYRRFDYVVINDCLDVAVEELVTIIRATRLSQDRRSALAEEILRTFEDGR